MRLSPKPTHGKVELLMQLLQVQTDPIAHLHVLEVVPASFVPRIQIRSIPRKSLQPYPPTQVQNEVLDLRSAMNG